MQVKQLCEGEELFASTGVSRLKVTRNGKVEHLELPIKSVDMAKAVDLTRGAPTAPGKKALIDGEWIMIPDTSDAEFRKKMAEHNERMFYIVSALGLNVKFKDKDGVEVSSPDKIISILKGQGLTLNHVQKLAKDIQALTSEEEQRAENFTSLDSPA